jgi:hypothetical protein
VPVLPHSELERIAGWVIVDPIGVKFHESYVQLFPPARKAEIVRRHNSGKEPVSNLADRISAQSS